METISSDNIACCGVDKVFLFGDLQLCNNETMLYVITAAFDVSSLSATAWAYALNGTPYVACSTVQYGFKPSTNYAIVTVEPQATQITADSDMSVSQANETTTQSSAQIPPQKTPEEIQKEAEQSGALSVWHEFSWWCPWYRLHIDAHINPSLSYGLDLFGGGYLNLVGAQNKSNIDMDAAGYGAITEAGLVTTISAGIVLWPEKITAVLVGAATLYAGTMAAIGSACACASTSYQSFAWGMLPILSLALYMTFNWINPLVWLKSVYDLLGSFSNSPLLANALIALRISMSFAMAMVWPPSIRGMLSIPIVLCILSIWILMGF